METIFRDDTLHGVVKSIQESGESDAGSLHASLQAAQAELNRIFPEDFVGVAIAIAVLVVVDTMLIIEDVHMIHYIATH